MLYLILYGMLILHTSLNIDKYQFHFMKDPDIVFEIIQII